MSRSISLIPEMNPDLIEAGLDEAGRGPLAGPVFAAAVILPHNFHHPLLNDSKQMSVKNRELLKEIIEKESVAWSVVAVDAGEIDSLNILGASLEAMRRSIDKLKITPEFLLIDGNRWKSHRGIPFKTVVHGDATYANIAAASVLAKTYRDAYMTELAEKYPEYGWDRNMGYPTKEHIEAIKKFGLTPFHRRSFHPKELEPTLFD